LGAALPPCGLLQAGILREPRVELHQALGACQQGQQDVLHFVLRAIFDGLLRQMDACAHLVEDATRLHMCYQGGQTRLGAWLGSNGCDTLRHADAPPELSETTTPDTLRMHQPSPFWQAHPCDLLTLFWTKIRQNDRARYMPVDPHS